MAKGVIDGAVVPWEVVPAVKVHEAAKFHTETDPNLPAMYTAVFLLAMNSNTYDGLPPELKAVIDSNSGLEFSGKAGRLWEEQKAPARRLALERGNNVYVVPASELVNWQRAALPVIADWIATWVGATSTTPAGRARALRAQ
jgi:TRAP-type C4-dicarboxylate transport system substrate-binding protein